MIPGRQVRSESRLSVGVIELEDTPPTRWRPPSGSAFGAKSTKLGPKDYGPIFVLKRSQALDVTVFRSAGTSSGYMGSKQWHLWWMQYLGVVMRFTLLIFFQSIHTLHEALVTVPLTGYACQCMCCNVSWAFHTQHQVLSAMIAPCPHGSGCILYFGVIQKCWLVKSFALLSSNVFTCNIILESFLFMFKHINLYYLLKIKS